ncbi:hypothetical protein GGS20DRAFT_469684 [Poronia punctata]|nr:hypothetical protein GGS20DRAFT_469684 [Poronia punctata]
MSLRNPASTPEDYARAILSLSQRTSGVSVFPGDHYRDIVDWLISDRTIFNSRKEEGRGLIPSISEPAHDLVVVYNSRAGKWPVQRYSPRQHDAFFATNTASGDTAASETQSATGEIVFIRGSISPSWLAAIGSKYSIDPEFFRRHMDFLIANTLKHCYSTPSLASSANNIHRLCVSTLILRNVSGNQDVPWQRFDQSAELAEYKRQQLRSKARCGDSIVREYSTVCNSVSVVEQWISFCLTRSNGSWAIIVWMDQGRPLEKSPPGPWTHHLEAEPVALPILQHHHKMAFRTTTAHLDTDENAKARIQQSTAVLPLQYDSLIELVDLARQAPHDPLSMCIPLFAHAVYSEAQFLNLMESRIQEHMNGVAAGFVPSATLGTFQYFSTILSRHAQQLKDSNHALRKLADHSVALSGGVTAGIPTPSDGGTPGYDWKSAEDKTANFLSFGAPGGPFTAKGLQEDYDQLHARCANLVNMCYKGMALAMNVTAIEESRKAIEQSGRVKKLTLLATLFIPLSFTSGLFGMNLNLLGQSSVKWWWFFVLCIPITLFAYVFYLWDYDALKGYINRLAKHSSFG